MVKICLISEGTYPISIGGVSKWIHTLVSNMPEIEFEIISLVPDKKIKYNYELPKNIKNVHLWPIWDDDDNNGHEGYVTANDNSSSRKLKQYFKSEVNNLSESDYMKQGFLKPLKKIFNKPLPKADIYHAVNSGYAGLIGSLAKKIYSKPLIITEHGSYYKEWYLRLSSVDFPDELKHPQMLKPQNHKQIKLLKLIRKIVTFSFNQADIISPVTATHIPLELKLGADPKKIKAIPNGVDHNRFKKNDMQIDTDEITVGTIARLNPIKDVKTLIRAAKIVTSKKDNVHFEFIGPQEDKQYTLETKELVEDLGLEDKFKFMQETLNPEEVYRKFSVFTLSSISEAQPLAILEAMSSGIPVVATRVGGVPEPVSGNGLLVNPGDYNNFAKSILFFINNSNNNKIVGESSRNKIERFYSEKQFINCYRNLYSTFYKT
jgi:glycosyltransferase involved in cell wall biosynthesis